MALSDDFKTQILARMVNHEAALDIFLTGPAGSGKSLMARQLAEVMIGTGAVADNVIRKLEPHASPVGAFNTGDFPKGVLIIDDLQDHTEFFKSRFLCELLDTPPERRCAIILLADSTLCDADLARYPALHARLPRALEVSVDRRMKQSAMEEMQQEIIVQAQAMTQSHRQRMLDEATVVPGENRPRARFIPPSPRK